MTRNDHQSHNKKAKKHCAADDKDLMGKGLSLYFALYESAGAPKWVYQNHTTKKCCKQNQYEKKLSGIQCEMNQKLRAMKKKYKNLEEVSIR